MHLKLPSVKCTCVLCLTTRPYTLSTNWPVQHKLGLIRKENTSPKCQTSPEMSICPRLQRQTAVTSGPQSGWRAHGSPEAVSDSLSRNYLVVQTNCCISCLGGLVSDCLAGEEAGCGDPGLGYTRFWDCRNVYQSCCPSAWPIVRPLKTCGIVLWHMCNNHAV